MHDNNNAKSTQFERNYRKAYMALLSSAKSVDAYYFGTDEERDEDTEEMRPYFYGFIVISAIIGVWLLTQN